MDFETSEIINSNGTVYRVGWDEAGWFSIERGEMWEGEYHQSDDPIVSFPPDKVDKITELVEERMD